VVIGVLAQLLDAAVEVAEHGVEVDDLLAVELEDDAQDTVGGRMLGPHVDEHLAVAKRVELGFALRPRRVWRDRLEDAGLLVEHDPRVVGRGVARVGRGHDEDLLTSAPGLALRGEWVCSMWRTPPPGERAESSAR
jgi:hypothetical protein